MLVCLPGYSRDLCSCLCPCDRFRRGLLGRAARRSEPPFEEKSYASSARKIRARFWRQAQRKRLPTRHCAEKQNASSPCTKMRRRSGHSAELEKSAERRSLDCDCGVEACLFLAGQRGLSPEDTSHTLCETGPSGEDSLRRGPIVAHRSLPRRRAHNCSSSSMGQCRMASPLLAILRQAHRET